MGQLFRLGEYCCADPEKDLGRCDEATRAKKLVEWDQAEKAAENLISAENTPPAK
jgi:hypothetical protein